MGKISCFEPLAQNVGKIMAPSLGLSGRCSGEEDEMVEERREGRRTYMTSREGEV